VRSYDGAAWSAQAFVERLGTYGTSRVQLLAAEQDSTNNASQILVDQSWILPAANRLTTGVSLGQETITGQRYNTVSLLASGGGNLTDTLTLDGNARINYTRNNGSGVGAYINVTLNWAIDTHWTVSATAYDNRDNTAQLYVIAPPSQDVPTLPVQQSRAYFLTLRYEDRAGTPRAPIGGAPGSAGGSLVGYIFLDANDDGRRNSNENGAANVTVLLDGRFAARTDTQGRFEFPLVAVGTHSVSVIADNLPLPWAVNDDGRREVTIRTRETATLEIPAVRLR
jgi:hypothetical protein